MADLSSEFKKFHDRISLDSSKKDYLKNARNALREKIRKHFRDQLKLNVPKFRGQGSYAMGTTVNPLDGEFDIDDGVYLQHLDPQDDTEWPTPETVHRWLFQATDGHTSEKPVDKLTCVRVRYAGQHHVDFPAYGELNADYLLAVKGNKGWHRSDPLAITDWFRNQVEFKCEQLRRVVRYFKAWADFQSGRKGKMPNSLILTILAAEYFVLNERDDISMAETAYAVSDAVNPIFIVNNPVDIREELTARLTAQQKTRFKEAVVDLAYDAAEAVRTGDATETSGLWRKQFGDRFPMAIPNKQNSSQSRQNAAALSAFFGSKNPTKPWGYP